VLAPVLTLQTLGDHLRSGGSVVSIVAESPRDGSAQAAMKAALAEWTAARSTHFGTRGITLNVVAAGKGHELGYDGLTAAAPSAAAELSRLALFLSTPGARHITGQTLHVSSGTLAHFG
jgi:NAD(P)-dependent dehydrogenase (short-subunit alcohol dehydrogenase family)